MARGILSVGSLVAVTLATCDPPAKTSWLIGTNHKTGTQLVSAVLREWQNNGGVDFIDMGWSTVRRAKGWREAGYRVVEWHHFVLRTAEDVEEVLGDDGRATLFFRDPTEVVLSGYFYHLRSKEGWLHEPADNSSNVNLEGFEGDLDRTCGSRPGGDVDAQRLACDARRLVKDSSLTYAELLRGLSPTDGILVEAHRALRLIRDMNATKHSIQGYPVYAADLGKTMSDFRGEFRRIITHLGIDDVETCVDLAARHDLTAPNVTTSHAMAKHLVEDREKLRTFLLNSAWYEAVVEPLRYALNYTK